MFQPRKDVRPFSLLIKPASADCNLRCAYCFYAHRKTALHPGNDVPRMTDTVLSQVISQYMGTGQPHYVFGWQGGEPTLMGLDFFRRVIGLQRKYGRQGDVVANAVQTNGTLIDDQWAGFLAENNFLVGLSIDGPPTVHDQYRIYGTGRGSHWEVMRAVACLQRHHVQFNAMVLVSRASAGCGREIYRYLRDQGIFHHQYIECAEFAFDGSPLPFTLRAEEWGEFLCEIFDEWLCHDTRRISVRLFDSILSSLIHRNPAECRMAGDCRQYFVVECNGDVYPCDFFVVPELRLGNISNSSWDELQSAAPYLRFGEKKKELAKDCRCCPYLQFCRGDCPRLRRATGASPGRGKSWFCAGWQLFYSHALPALQNIARELMPS